MLGVLPFVNEVRHGAKVTDAAVDVGKGAKKAGKALGVIDDAVDIGKTADKVEDIYSSVKTASKSSPSKLIPTHRPTLSRREYDKLLSDIQKNGITEPIKYIEHKGVRYVVDGHHRLRAAKELKLDSVPIQKVELPYKGYKLINDLLWFE